MDSQPQGPKFLDQIRSTLRLHRYSIHIERSYLEVDTKV
jgi:hypothetical protein